MRARPLLGSFAIVAALLAAVPARAIPFGPPQVLLALESTGSTWTAHADAYDPDGAIELLRVCFEGVAEPACTEVEAGDRDQVQAVLDCVEGGEASVAHGVTIEEPGIYRATAFARAGGCPLVGAGQGEAGASHDLLVPTDDPFRPVACAAPGPLAATEVGVDATTIRIGVLASLTGPLPGGKAAAIEAIGAVAEGVSGLGGVCGRSIELVIADDQGTDSVMFARFDELAAETVAVFLLSDRAHALIAAGRHRDAGVPVLAVAADHPILHADDEVWNVATSQESFASVAVADAVDDGAETFAITILREAPWGQEAARALIAEIEAAGGRVAYIAEVGLVETNYTPYITRMQQECGGPCDAVVGSLHPSGAIRWIRAAQAQGAMPPIVTSFSEHAFARALGVSCDPCEGVTVWTGFDPAVPGTMHGSLRYASAMAEHHRFDSSGLAGFAAAEILLQAMGDAGADLTRADLRTALDAGSFDTQMAGAPLSWAGGRQANRMLEGFTIDLGWRRVRPWRAAS